MAEKQNWASYYYILRKVYEDRHLFYLKENAQMNNAQ